MRVILDDAHIIYAVIDKGPLDWSSGNPMYHQCDTIEITYAQWDEIGKDYVNNYEYGLFKEGYAVWRGLSQYLKDLILLRG